MGNPVYNKEGEKMKHNPFKMIGPWIGAGVGLFLCLGSFLPFVSLISSLFFYPLSVVWQMVYYGHILTGMEAQATPSDASYILLLLLPIYGIIVGFLIGWGIESWIRKVKK